MTAVLLLGASPFEMGLLAGASAAAVLAFGLLAGVCADRLRRRPILICTDLLRALLLATVPLAAIAGRLTMAQLYLVAAGAGLFTVLFDSAYQAYVPGLVSRAHLMQANSRLTLTETVAEIAGPGLTGVLVQMLTAPVAILFDAASFVFSAVSIWAIRGKEADPEAVRGSQVTRDIAVGLATIRRDPVLRAMAARTATVSFFLGFIGSLYVLFAIRELRLSALLLGLVIMVGGVAALIGALLTPIIAARIGIGPAYIAGAFIGGVSALIPPLAHGSVAACFTILALAQLGDVAWPMVTISETTLRQSITPERVLGRVNSAMLLLFRGLLPIGAFAGGALAQATSIRLTMLIGGGGVLLSSLWLAFSPIRHVRDAGARSTSA